MMDSKEKLVETNTFHEKKFIMRNSILTNLFENKHICTVYNVFKTILVGFFIDTILQNYLKNKELNFGLELIFQCFGKFHIVIQIWILYFAAACSSFFFFMMWSTYRRRFRKLLFLKIWDRLWILLLLGYYVSSFKTGTYLMTHFQLPSVSSAIIAAESIRFLMKIHSFVRSNAPLCIKSEEIFEKPQFSKFIYFLFVPTLLYRDSYPRKDRIDWNFVLCRLVEVISSICFLNFIFDRLIRAPLRNFGLRVFTLEEIVLFIFKNSVLSSLILLPGFFVILHSFQNLFAEITRFGDRLFYDDWWTCTDYSTYFRKWNIIVQDWLYAYIYKEFKEYICSNTFLAKFCVFFISALVHEWIYINMLGFFFPANFTIFLFFGFPLTYFNVGKSFYFNVLFLYTVFLGTSLLLTMYTMEYFARTNLSVENPTTVGQEFVMRNSLLTDLFMAIHHLKTVYHLFITIFVVLFLNTTLEKYIKNEEIDFGLTIIRTAFGKIHIALLLWLSHFFATCLSYFIVKIWISTRKHNKNWNYFWGISLPIYYIYSFKISGQLVIALELPPASAAFVTMEQVRLLMKTHSFVRTVTAENCKKNENRFTFSKFCYFLFAPTLIYRNDYPNKASIEWKFVISRLLECVGTIFFLSFVLETFLIPSIKDFGKRQFALQEVILIMFKNTFSGILILLPFFFILLHSWQNLFAEITRFGDRLFYEDWWNCTDFSDYFRKWNVVVQQWLYLYIYRDFFENIYQSSTVAKFLVFFVSAVVHEWVLTCMFGFFFPLNFIEFFVFGVLLHYLGSPKKPCFNILFWYLLSFGMGTLVTLYGIEHYARKNAPLENATYLENLMPRFLTCNCII